MNSNFKKYFSLDTSKLANMSENEKTLIETGHSLVKCFIEKKVKADGRKSFAEILDGSKMDDYEVMSRKFNEKLVKYSLEKAGEDVENFDISCVKNPMINKKTIFRETFNAIVTQIISPVIPAMVSATFMDMADVANVGYGDTARFVVRPNDIFFVTRYAEGVLDGTVQRVYNNELTVNPEPYGIKTTIDWYQVASGVFDIGDFAYRVSNSFNAYVNQMVVAALSKNIAAGIAASMPYFTNGFTTKKFATLIDKLSAANGGANITTYGTLSALSAVLPEGGSSSNIANMQIGNGEQWAQFGYLSTYMGSKLVRVPQIILPNTVNTTALFGVPNDTIYMFADGGYKPVKLVFEGNAVTIDIVPNESSDKELGIDVQLRMGQTFIAASKYGAITGVSLA